MTRVYLVYTNAWIEPISWKFTASFKIYSYLPNTLYYKVRWNYKLLLINQKRGKSINSNFNHFISSMSLLFRLHYLAVDSPLNILSSCDFIFCDIYQSQASGHWPRPLTFYQLKPLVLWTHKLISQNSKEKRFKFHTNMKQTNYWVNYLYVIQV